MQPRDEMQRLEEAAAAFLQFRSSGGSVEELLAAHEHLRDLLEPMLAEASAPGALPVQTGLEGRTLGDFRLLREIGRGGMGVVFEAQQLSLDRRVAVKVLPQSLTAGANAVVRFKREAGVAARLQHEGIVEVYAVGSTDELHWFAMELIDGLGLEQVIAECRSLPVETLDGEAVRRILERRLAASTRSASRTSTTRMRGYVGTVVDLVAQVADALEHAHAAGVIHRDVKPSNILLRADGRPVLTDFGLAREEGLPSISRTGEFAGTPYYVAPEQAQMRRQEVDCRADVFALGVTLYELLTLTRPFEGETTQLVLQRIITREPPDPRRRNRNLAEDLVAVLMKALEKEPGRRYQTAAAMADDLRAVLALQPVSARRWTRTLRFRQWMRREPLKAALIAVLAAGVPTLLVLGGYVLVKQREITAGAAGLREAAYEVKLAKGLQRLNERRFAEAEAALTTALEELPDAPEAIAGLALVDLNRVDKAAAMRRFDAYPEAMKASTGLQRLRGAMQGGPDAPVLGTGEGVTSLELFLAGMTEFDQYQKRRDPVAAAKKALRWFDDAVVRAQRSRVSYLMMRARAAAVAGDEERAVQSVDAILSLWPEAPGQWSGIGYVLQDFDPPRSLAAFRRAVAEEPGNALLHTNVAVVLRKTGDDAAAEKAFQRALELDPKHMQTRVKYAFMLIDGKRTDEGLAQLQQGAELGDDPGEYARWAEECMRAGRMPDAIAICERMLPKYPDGATLHQAYGHALMRSSRLDEAIVELQRACELAPKLDQAWYTLGVALTSKRDPTYVDAFRKTVELKPDHYPALDAIGRDHMQKGEYEQAVSTLQKAVAANPRYARALSALGIALLRAGRLDQAPPHLQKAEELDKATANYHRSVCRQLARDPQQREAVIVLCRLDLLRDPEAADSHALLTEALRRSGDLKGLGAQLRTWAQAHPGDAGSSRALATHLVDAQLPETLRDPAAALAAARRAVELAADDAQNGLVLADALFASGDGEAARRQLDVVADKAQAAGLGEQVAARRVRFAAR